jgi:hypothetical protein
MLVPKLCACAYANTVPCVCQHRLPPLHLTVTSVPVTDLVAVVDLLQGNCSVDLCDYGTDLFSFLSILQGTQLLLIWFLSMDLCDSGTDLFSFLSILIWIVAHFTIPIHFLCICLLLLWFLLLLFTTLQAIATPSLILLLDPSVFLISSIAQPNNFRWPFWLVLAQQCLLCGQRSTGKEA